MARRIPRWLRILGGIACIPAAFVGFLLGWCWIEREWPADLYRSSPAAECRLVTYAARGEQVREIHAVCGRSGEDGDSIAFWSYPERGFDEAEFLRSGTYRPVTPAEFRSLVGEKYWKRDDEFPLYYQKMLRIRLDGDLFRIEQEYDKDEFRNSSVSAYRTDGRDIGWLKRDYYDKNCFTFRVLDRKRYYGS